MGFVFAYTRETSLSCTETTAKKHNATKENVPHPVHYQDAAKPQAAAVF